MVAELQESFTTNPDWPPLMPWRSFADWCRIEPGIVQGWVERDYLPTTRVGKHRMMNLAALIGQLKEGAEMVAMNCLATGCRWGEAQALIPVRVRGGQISFTNTKSKRTRSVPISSDLEERIHHHFKHHGFSPVATPHSIKRSNDPASSYRKDSPHTFYDTPSLVTS